MVVSFADQLNAALAPHALRTYVMQPTDATDTDAESRMRSVLASTRPAPLLLPTREELTVAFASAVLCAARAPDSAPQLQFLALVYFALQGTTATFLTLDLSSGVASAFSEPGLADAHVQWLHAGGPSDGAVQLWNRHVVPLGAVFAEDTSLVPLTPFARFDETHIRTLFVAADAQLRDMRVQHPGRAAAKMQEDDHDDD